MNDELISSLRICGRINSANDNCIAFHDGSCEAEPVCMYELMGKAADAIEELQAVVDGLTAQTNMVFEETEGRTVIKFEPKWIPVEERLPCLTTPVLATDGIEVDIAWMYGVPPRWITSFTAIDEDKLTHWMPLPQTPKEE